MTSVADIFTAAERAALAPPPDLVVSQWAKRYRRMSSMSSPRAGSWDSALNPYVDEIMDARSDLKCRVAVPVLPTQSGKSEAMLNAIGWTADVVCEPQIVTLPTDATRSYFMLRRLIPMFLASGRLARLMTGKARDEKMAELQLLHSVIYTATGNSPSEAASKPAGSAYMDEVDRYPTIISSKEGSSAVDLVLERLRAWGGESFAWITSTPTTRNGIVWTLLEGTDFRQYHVACPICRKRFVPTFEQLRPRGVQSWADVDPLEIVTRKLAAHHCPCCGDEIPDAARPAMISSGVWVPRGHKVRDDGEVLGPQDSPERGWHAEALVCLNETPSTMAADFMRARRKTNGLQRFVNLRRAMVWEDKLENPEIERIHQLRLPYERGRIPGDVVFLTAGVDVQKYGFYFVIRGWAPGTRSYLIAWGYVEAWAAVLRAIVRERYKSTDGAQAFQVVRALVDSSEGVRTEEIYRVVNDYADVLSAAKGQRSILGHMVKTVSLRSSKTEIGEGLPLTHVNTSWAKDRLARDLGNGTFFVPESVDEPYVRQLCAEHKVRKVTPAGEKSVWEKKQGVRENHYLDCEVLALAAAEMAGLAGIDEGPAGEFEAEAVRPAPPAQSPGRARDDDDDWIKAPDNWLDEYDRNW